ncbi:MAG: hypothetical protein K2X81_13700 [Candidatus Obscuribacterales bacterium]|nr:hypothetical protein [Candidatus Obscuribacterales bacterium]
MSKAVTLNQSLRIEETSSRANSSSSKTILGLLFATLVVAVTMTFAGFFSARTGASLGMAIFMPTQKLAYLSTGLLLLYSAPIIHSAMQKRLMRMVAASAPLFFVFGAILFTYSYACDI